MRGLTLIAPMGQAIVWPSSCPKRIENREKSMPKTMVGVSSVVAVHCGLKWSPEYADTVLRILGPTFDMEKAASGAGHIIGLMRLTGKQFTAHEPVMLNDGTLNPWFSGPVGYEIAEAEALPIPLVCRGGINFWPLLPDVEAKVWEQLPHWRGK